MRLGFKSDWEGMKICFDYSVGFNRLGVGFNRLGVEFNWIYSVWSRIQSDWHLKRLMDSKGLKINSGWVGFIRIEKEWKFVLIIVSDSIGLVSDSIGFIRFEAGFIRIEIWRLTDWKGFKRIKKSFRMRLGFIRIKMWIWLGFGFI